MRLNNDPLRVLISLEAAIVVLAFIGEATVWAFRVEAIHPVWPFLTSAPAVAAYFAITIATACAVFAIPHAPNRRYWLIAFSIAGICAARAFPTHEVLPQTLVITLSARLVFAFGFRGFILASVTELLSGASLATTAVLLKLAPLKAMIFDTYFDVVLFVLIFGLVGISWLYANKASAAATAAERVRIALELHDSLGHGLTTLSVQLQNADRLRQNDPDKAAAYVKRGIATATDLLSDVRETVAVLHDTVETTPEPTTAPLRVLLARVRADFAGVHRVRASWHVEIANEPSGRVAMVLYRVLQEALTNVMRHAHATHVEVRLCGNDREVDLSIEDDGSGFAGEVGAGHGLMFMRMRVESIGGRFNFSSREGTGTRLQAVIPLEAGA